MGYVRGAILFGESIPGDRDIFLLFSLQQRSDAMTYIEIMGRWSDTPEFSLKRYLSALCSIIVWRNV